MSYHMTILARLRMYILYHVISCYILLCQDISYDTSTSISRLMLASTYISSALPIHPCMPDSSSASAAARVSINSSRVLSLPSLQLNSSDLWMWHMLQGSAELVLFIKPAMSHCSGQSPAWKQRGNTTCRILPSEQRISTGL